MILKQQSADSQLAIEMTPMIDIVFLLLIFFLVATTFRQEEREMQIALPIASSAGPISMTLRELVVNVDENGRMIIAGREVSGEDLLLMITDAVAVNAEQKVTVRGDRRVAYESVVRVLDICKTGGVQQPYLDTVIGE